MWSSSSLHLYAHTKIKWCPCSNATSRSFKTFHSLMSLGWKGNLQ
ncbi:unnamed protein product [Prunus brigantina]